jgi:hypothetical protein
MGNAYWSLARELAPRSGVRLTAVRGVGKAADFCMFMAAPDFDIKCVSEAQETTLAAPGLKIWKRFRRRVAAGKRSH